MSKIFAQPRVAVFSASRYVRSFMRAPLERVSIPTFVEAPLSVETVHLAAGHDIVNAFVNDDLSAPVLDALVEAGVGAVTLRCAGFDRLDAEHAKKIGMRVLRVPAYSPRSVAELALSLAMALHRNFQRVLPRVKNGVFTLDGLEGRELTGSTVGIVGTGKIGVEFARLVKPMAGRILAYDVFENQDAKDLGVEYVSMDELLSSSDVVSLHCPLMESTRHVVNADALSKMKRDAFLINTARGGLVDTEDLVDAIERGVIGGAALDVYEQEAALFFTDRSLLSTEERIRHWDALFSRLSNLPNVIVTPHVAFLTREALANIADTTAENVKAAFWRERSNNDVVHFRCSIDAAR